MIMQSIVVINGSPKLSSDSAGLAKRFCDEITRGSENIEVEIFNLSQRKIAPCTGCMACTRNGVCAFHDDMDLIRDSLRKAALVIFTSPVHFNHPSALFHTFVERSLLQLHTFEYLKKPFINFVSTNGSGEEDADKYLSKIGLLFGMVKIGFSFISKNDPFREKEFNSLITKTKQYLTGGIKAKPSLMNNLYFSSMKGIIRKNPKFFEYENKIWADRGWFQKNYKKAEIANSGHSWR
jgi:multimeric flavodoxin WrbA